jgi:hypothetical protein
MLNDVSYVHIVVTQGEPYDSASQTDERSYVTSYQVMYGQDGVEWQTVAGRDSIITVIYTLSRV